MSTARDRRRFLAGAGAPRSCSALEGFTEVEYVGESYPKSWEPVAKGAGDVSMETAPNLVRALDHGADVMTIGGVHAGCYEPCAANVHAIRGLAGLQ